MSTVADVDYKHTLRQIHTNFIYSFSFTCSIRAIYHIDYKCCRKLSFWIIHNVYSIMGHIISDIYWGVLLYYKKKKCWCAVAAVRSKSHPTSSFTFTSLHSAQFISYKLSYEIQHSISNINRAFIAFITHIPWAIRYILNIMQKWSVCVLLWRQ